jgi:hypothetical protein
VGSVGKRSVSVPHRLPAPNKASELGPSSRSSVGRYGVPAWPPCFLGVPCGVQTVFIVQPTRPSQQKKPRVSRAFV